MLVARLKDVLRFIVYFIRTKKSWRWPRRSKVLVFDACNLDLLEDYLQPWDPEVLHVRGETINARVALASLLNGGLTWDAYADCFIRRVGPILVLSLIDNRPAFLTISQRHAAVKTAFVQNGWRSYYGDIFETLDKMDPALRSKSSVDHMLVFGSAVGSEYSRYLHGDVIPIGSLKNNRLASTQPLQRDVLAFISQWAPDGIPIRGKFYSQAEFFAATDRPIIQCLARYASRNGKTLRIIPRSTASSSLREREKEYFRAILGADVEFLEPPGMYPSYQAVDAAEVVVAVDTTLGYEAIARGKKTAMFSVRSAVLAVPGFTYGWPAEFPAEGPFWTNRRDSESFDRILDHLFAVDQAGWVRDLEATNFQSLMIHDPGNTILQSYLRSQLGDGTGDPVGQGSQQ